MSNMYLREIINNATIILCCVAMMKILFKMNKIKKEVKEEEKRGDWNTALRFAFFIEFLCVTMLIFNIILWKSIFVPFGILVLAFIMQYDKILYILCNEEQRHM